MHRVLPDSNQWSPTGEDDFHPLDNLCGFKTEKKVHYVWVGEGKGRYQVSGQSNYYYVGPHNGSYEQEETPPDHTPRCVCLLCVILFLSLVLVYALKQLSNIPIYDCQAGIENFHMGWSLIKKHYCCELRGVACPGDHADDYELTPADIVPRWLTVWLPEVAIGSKFMMCSFAFLALGLSSGCCMIYTCTRYCTSRNNKTEEEILTSLEDSREAQGGERDGEVCITMTWDSHDELDLQLELPDDKGIICHRMPEIAGGIMDINRNAMKTKGRRLPWPPVENIFWEPYCPYSSDNPPNGEYNLWVRVLHKRNHNKDTNLTVSRQVAGRTKLYHRRIPPGTRELHICDFTYLHPRKISDKEADMLKHHKLFSQEKDIHKGPLSVSMVWDTKDVLDLQVKQPGRAGTRYSMDGSADSHHDPQHSGGRSYIELRTPPSGMFEIRAVITDKKEDRDVYITVVVNMKTKRKVFHHKIEGEASCFVGTFMYKPPPS